MLPTPTEPDEPGPRAGNRRRLPRDGRRPPFVPSPGLVLLRIAIVALALVLGVVLLTRGDLLLGGLLVAIGALRLGLVVTMRRRRAQWREAGGRAGR